MAARVTVVFATTSQQPHHPRHYHLMAEGLRRAGITAHMVAQPDHTEQPEGPVPTHYVHVPPGRLARFLSAPRVLRRALALRPDVVHVTSLDLLPWAVLLRLVARVPVLYDSNEDYPADVLLKEWLPRPARLVLSRIVTVAEPACAAALDGVTLADTGTAANFRRIRTPLVVVRNYPWTDAVAPTAEPASDDEISHDVTYHGSLPQLYLDPILATASELRRRGLDVRWCLAARDYRADERVELEKMIADRGLAGAVDLRFNRPFTEMPALLAATRLGFIPLPDRPKFHRNLPRKLFEYLAAGKPAVVSDLPPIREVIGDEGCCLLVRPGDATESADALAELLADPARAREMGERGRRLVLDRLNAGREVEPYAAYVRALADRPAPDQLLEARNPSS